MKLFYVEYFRNGCGIPEIFTESVVADDFHSLYQDLVTQEGFDRIHFVREEESKIRIIKHVSKDCKED